MYIFTSRVIKNQAPPTRASIFKSALEKATAAKENPSPQQLALLKTKPSDYAKASNSWQVCESFQHLSHSYYPHPIGIGMTWPLKAICALEELFEEITHQSSM